MMLSQKIGGCLILKLPHVYSKILLDLIHILSLYYKISFLEVTQQNSFKEKFF